ncbi:caspase domain-containing protein [Hypoxylon argillaceum]|nr:caspase domain-containing protein [Hypoxylon argillaceum]
MSPTTKTWAVLIGIDQYPTPILSLDGCANDIADISNVLRDNLKVSPHNIQTFISRTGAPRNEEPASSPTKANVIAALENVTAEAGIGDFIYVHYSGHGDREQTAHPDKKSKEDFDEVLCTLDADITDVEFGALLDTMANKGLIVLVVLDCCHSGGATRADGAKIRCRQSHKDRIKASRNAGSRPSWLYRPREYNLVAACQSHEYAREYTANNKTNGALTYFLIETLKSYNHSALPTYQDLIDVLDVKVPSKVTGQRPVHLGPHDRTLFNTTSPAPTSSTVRACVTDVSPDLKLLCLDKGSAAGVATGDIYDIYPPELSCIDASPGSNPESVIRVVVQNVSNMSSQATPHGSGEIRSQVQRGWFAKLSSRAKAATIVVTPASYNHSSAIMKLQSEWVTYVDSTAPVHLYFDTLATCTTDFTVSIDCTSHFEFKNSKGEVLPNIPCISWDDENMVERVMQVLKHLVSYHLVAQLKHSSNVIAPKYELHLDTLGVEPEYRAEGVLATRTVGFTNHHTSVLYVAILNLTPAYGIHQLFPSQDAASKAVEPGQSIQEFIVDFKAPDILKADAMKPGFEIKDVLRVIITTEPTDFRHMRLADMKGDLKFRKLRTAYVRQPKTTSWFVDDREVISQGLGSPS